jgi:hypothetical protein
MRNDHILVGAIESDVMVGLRERNYNGCQQENKGKKLFHRDRYSGLNINVLGAKIVINGKKQKNYGCFLDFRVL